MIVYFAPAKLDLNTDFLIPFGAGNFIYIGASDLIPQVNKEKTIKCNIVYYSAFLNGLLLLYVLSIL